jgi:TolA-binding protein
MKIPVKNNKMIRDTSTGAVLSVDQEAVKDYEERRKKILSERERLNRLESEISELRAIIDELRKK